MIAQNSRLLADENVFDTFWVKEDGVWLQKSAFTSSKKMMGVITMSGGSMVKGDRKGANPWSWGRTIHNPLSGSSECVDFPGYVRMSTTRKSGPLYAYPSSDVLYAYSPIHSDIAANMALSRVNEQVRGTLDLSVDVMQGKQLGKLLNLKQSAIKMAGDLKKIAFEIQKAKLILSKPASDGRHRAATAALKLWSEKHLEVAYGWKPLMGSVYGVCDTLLNVTLSKASRVKARGKDDSRQVVKGLTLGLDKGRVAKNGRLVIDRQSRCQVELSFKTDSDDPAKWSSLNPISVAYELIPYSFVVDWFYDIGGYLRSVETSLIMSNRFISGYVSEIASVECTSEFSDAGVGYSCAYKGYKLERTFKRKVLVAYPGPRMPSFRTNLGSSQLLSAAALLAVFLK